MIVYQKEPHAGQLAFKDIPQPEDFVQRCELARRMKTEYELPMTVLVDQMDDQSRALFSDLPSPAFVIDADGIVRAKFPWADAETIETAVTDIHKSKKKRGVNPAVFIAALIPVFLLPMIIGASKAKKKSDEAAATESAEKDAN